MTIHRSPLTGRKKVDLRSSLPRWLALLLGAAITVGVVLLAWLVGRDQPVPAWVREKLVPVLGWTYIALALVAIVAAMRRRAARRKDQ